MHVFTVATYIGVFLILPCTDDIRVVDIRTTVLEVQEVEVCQHDVHRDRISYSIRAGMPSAEAHKVMA